MEAYPKTSIVSLNGRLSLDGIRLVNERGENVVLRGISTHGIAWNPKSYHEESIRTLVEEWGITLFRIAVYTHE
jgi:endoglucanase